MAQNGEEFLIVISDDSGDEGQDGNIRGTDLSMEMNVDQQNEVNPGPMGPGNDYFNELQPIIQQVPPLMPEPSISHGSSSSSSSESGGTITITDSDLMEHDSSSESDSSVSLAAVLPPIPPLQTLTSKNVALSISGLDGHITVSAPTTAQGLRTAMIQILERNGIAVVSIHASSDQIRTLYFFHGHVTNWALNTYFEMLPMENRAEMILKAAMGEFLTEFPLP